MHGSCSSDTMHAQEPIFDNQSHAMNVQTIPGDATMATRSKEQLVKSILRQEFYQPDSGFYQSLFDRMMKLPYTMLQDLDLLLVMRVTESNELTRQVDKILAKV